MLLKDEWNCKTRGKILLFSLISTLSAAFATAPSFDCKKATTAVEKEICNNSRLAALDRVMHSIYAIALKERFNNEKIKHEQQEWLKQRPNDASALEDYYAKRIQTLVADTSLLQPFLKDFFAKYDKEIRHFTPGAKRLFDIIPNESIPLQLTFLIDAYTTHSLPTFKAPDLQDGYVYVTARLSSSIYNLSNTDYIFVYGHTMGCHNHDYSVWLIKKQKDDYKIINLPIPKYDSKTQTINQEVIILGWFAFDPVKKVLYRYTKGYGAGKCSTEYYYQIKDEQLILLKQRSTKDNYHEDYELTYTEADWVTDYSSYKAEVDKVTETSPLLLLYRKSQQR